MPLRLGNLRCGGTAGGSLCRDTSVSPSLPYGFAAEPKTGETGEESPGEEGKGRARGLRLSL